MKQTMIQKLSKGSHIPCPEGLTPFFTSKDNCLTLYEGEPIKIMRLFPSECFDLIFVVAPYFISQKGRIHHSENLPFLKQSSWNRTEVHQRNFDFTKSWLSECQRLMKSNAAIWISGINEIIHIVGCALEELDFKILNGITLTKTSIPKQSFRCFADASRTILWAGRHRKCKHTFNYKLMKFLNNGKQMKSVWSMESLSEEKNSVQFLSEKPLALLERIIIASTKEGNVIFDPFARTSTAGIAASRLKRNFVGIEQESEYLELSIKRYKREFVKCGYSALLNLERKIDDNFKKPAPEATLFPTK